MRKEDNGFENSSVRWNFQKYLVNEKGELIGVYYSKTKPESKELAKAIEQ
jgi:glutathione peroxidase